MRTDLNKGWASSVFFFPSVSAPTHQAGTLPPVPKVQSLGYKYLTWLKGTHLTKSLLVRIQRELIVKVIKHARVRIVNRILALRPGRMAIESDLLVHGRLPL